MPCYATRIGFQDNSARTLFASTKYTSVKFRERGGYTCTWIEDVHAIVGCQKIQVLIDFLEVQRKLLDRERLTSLRSCMVDELLDVMAVW
eukprot:4454609-Pleurochrysis_carterae.AAC.1